MSESYAQATSRRQTKLLARLGDCRPALIGRALRVLRNRADAEDAVQEAALLAWQHLNAVRDERHLSSWLHRITYHAAVDMARRRKIVSVCYPEDGLVAPGSSPEKAILEQTEAERLRRFILGLPSGYREPMSMRCLFGLSHEEIAGKLGMKTALVKTRVSRARKMILARYEDICVRSPLG
jgi:RNA polymerase sigma-70 factor (ECF subfamily)